jgi:CheY-like chemotaxis protein
MANTRQELHSNQQPVSVRSDDSFAARIIEAQDNERRKISRELHDSVGQSLVAIKMSIHRFKNENAIGDNRDLDEALRILDSTISEIRTLSHLLHPPNLELLGLRASLAWLGDGFEQRTGIQTRLEAPTALPPISTAAATAIFRIAQEALTNVHRHAQASRVILRVVFTRSELQVEIADDGKGFDDVEACRQGVGILGMQERLADLDGILRVESGRNAGTSVFATVPLETETRPESGETEHPLAKPVADLHGRAARILVVDDHPAMRQGVRTILDSCADLEVCGEAATPDEATRLIANLHPDIVLLDLQLGPKDGWSVVRHMRVMNSSAKIIIFSHFSERFVAAAAKNSGCAGFVSKSLAGQEMIEAIRTVLKGRKYYGPRALRQSA